MARSNVQSLRGRPAAREHACTQTRRNRNEGRFAQRKHSVAEILDYSRTAKKKTAPRISNAKVEGQHAVTHGRRSVAAGRSGRRRSWRVAAAGGEASTVKVTFDGAEAWSSRQPG